MAQSPWPLHCLIVINLLESHYLGTPITNDCDAEAVKAGFIFKTSEVILYIHSFCKKGQCTFFCQSFVNLYILGSYLWFEGYVGKIMSPQTCYPLCKAVQQCLEQNANVSMLIITMNTILVKHVSMLTQAN